MKTSNQMTTVKLKLNHLACFNGCFSLQHTIVTSTLTSWTCLWNTRPVRPVRHWAPKKHCNVFLMKSRWHTWNLCGSTPLPSLGAEASYLYLSHSIAKQGLERRRFKIPSKAGNAVPKIQNACITQSMREIVHSCPTYGKPECKNMNFNTKNTFLYILVSCSFSLLKTSISTVAHSAHSEFHPVPRQETGRSPLSLRAMWRTARVQQGDHDASR